MLLIGIALEVAGSLGCVVVAVDVVSISDHFVRFVTPAHACMGDRNCCYYNYTNTSTIVEAWKFFFRLEKDKSKQAFWCGNFLFFAILLLFSGKNCIFFGISRHIVLSEDSS